MQQLQSVFGILALLAATWILSADRRAINWRQTLVALAVTLITALVLFKIPYVEVRPLIDQARIGSSHLDAELLGG